MIALLYGLVAMADPAFDLDTLPEITDGDVLDVQYEGSNRDVLGWFQVTEGQRVVGTAVDDRFHHQFEVVDRFDRVVGNTRTDFPAPIQLMDGVYVLKAGTIGGGSDEDIVFHFLDDAAFVEPLPVVAARAVSEDFARHTYALSTTTGWLDIDVTGLPWELRNHDDVVVADADSPAPLEVYPGDYALVIGDDPAASGAYTVAVRERSEPVVADLGPLPMGATQSGALDVWATDSWTWTASDFDVVTITTPTWSPDLHWVVTDRLGTEVASGGAGDTLVLGNGAHTLSVTNLGQGTASYGIQVAAGGSPGAAPSLQAQGGIGLATAPASGTIASSSPGHAWTFTLLADARVAWRQVLGDELEPRLRDPYGQARDLRDDDWLVAGTWTLEVPGTGEQRDYTLVPQNADVPAAAITFGSVEDYTLPTTMARVDGAFTLTEETVVYVEGAQNNLDARISLVDDHGVRWLDVNLASLYRRQLTLPAGSYRIEGTRRSTTAALTTVSEIRFRVSLSSSEHLGTIPLGGEVTGTLTLRGSEAVYDFVVPQDDMEIQLNRVRSYAYSGAAPDAFGSKVQFGVFDVYGH
jgi:hypothetical protein